MNGPPSLQQLIEEAGSPMRLLWDPAAKPWHQPVVEREYVGWQAEQRASTESVSLSDLSYHMRDLVIEGPDATKLLADSSVNNYEKFADNQAKQFVAATARGNFVADGILMRDSGRRYVLTGPPTSHSWVLFQAHSGDYDVEFTDVPAAGFHKGPQLFFRFQIQGPNALDLVAKVFGGPLPETKFFHAAEVSLDGRRFRALRHVMASQPGYEFIGDFADHDYVREAFLAAGDEFGLVPMGSMAYSGNGLEGGWISQAVPGIYTDPELRPYREWLTKFTYEAARRFGGSFFSEDVEDYYCSPYELGYGRIMDLGHDFAARDALVAAKDDPSLRRKVTLVLDPRQSAEKLFGEPDDYFLSHGVHRVEAGGGLVGTVWGACHRVTRGTVFALALIDPQYAEPGTEIEFVYGSHPGPGNDPLADPGFARVKGTVAPAPYSDFARTEYRKPM